MGGLLGGGVQKVCWFPPPKLLGEGAPMSRDGILSMRKVGA